MNASGEILCRPVVSASAFRPCSTAVMSTWVALAIPISADAQGSAGYGLALLLGPPTGLVTSIYATRGRQVTAPQADVYVLSGNMGFWHGLAIGLIEDLEGREVAGATALGGLLGAGTGALLISPGRTRETAASRETHASMQVTETITVEAHGFAIKHGIIRDFPTRYKDSQGNRVEVGFRLGAAFHPLHLEKAQERWTALACRAIQKPQPGGSAEPVRRVDQVCAHRDAVCRRQRGGEHPVKRVAGEE